MMFLGLIGEYLGRMFQNQTADPQFVVRQVYTGSRGQEHRSETADAPDNTSADKGQLS